MTAIHVYPKPYPTREGLTDSQADQLLLAGELTNWQQWPFDLELELEGVPGTVCLYGAHARAVAAALLGLNGRWEALPQR